MHRRLTTSIALVGALTMAGSGCAWLGRASQTAAGDTVGAAGDRAAMSADGRYVAYAARTDTSAPGVLDGVYRWDTVTNTRKLVSVAMGGAVADDASGEPAISADGRYVAFSSDATNLVPNDTNDATDIFVRDLTGGTTTRVSVTSDGAEVDDNSYTPSISDDGRYVAFISDSDDLSSLDDNLSSDAYVFDRSARTVKLASIVGGVQPDFGITEAVLSGDGRHLAFTTDTDLVTGDENWSDDVYLKNLNTGSTAWVSRPKVTDPEGGGGDQPSISYDGQYVAFVGGQDIDNATDPYPGVDVFVRDTVNKTVRRVSTTSAGAFINGTSFSPAITSDGKRVAFASTGNASGNDTNGSHVDAFVKDLGTGRTTLVSTDMFLGQQAYDAFVPSISNDGRYASFLSPARLAVRRPEQRQRRVRPGDRRPHGVVDLPHERHAWLLGDGHDHGGHVPAHRERGADAGRLHPDLVDRAVEHLAAGRAGDRPERADRPADDLRAGPGYGTGLGYRRHRALRELPDDQVTRGVRRTSAHPTGRGVRAWAADRSSSSRGTPRSRGCRARGRARSACSRRRVSRARTTGPR